MPHNNLKCNYIPNKALRACPQKMPTCPDLLLASEGASTDVIMDPPDLFLYPVGALGAGRSSPS